jgi:hypothetical protein
MPGKKSTPNQQIGHAVQRSQKEEGAKSVPQKRMSQYTFR